MPLTDTSIKAFKPKEKPYKESDGGGMYLEVNTPSAKAGGFGLQLKPAIAAEATHRARKHRDYSSPSTLKSPSSWFCCSI